MFLTLRSCPVWSSLLVLASITPAAIAHNIQTDGTVGATFHIEPDHNPRAGEPATAWFALTQSGGKSLPFAQCDCQLAVYDRARDPETPVLTPSLKAIVAEQYRDIPGAEIIFPQAGIYELEISGSPKSGADFQPFSLAYSVTVTPGKTAEKGRETVEAPAVSVSSAPPAPDTEIFGGGQWWAAIGVGGAIAATILWIVRQNASK